MKKHFSPINPPEFKQTEVIGESLTVPNQVMSIREMINRHQQGLNVNGYKSPLPPVNDGYGVPIRKLDLVDQQIIMENAAADISDIEAKKAEKERIKAQKAREKEIDDEIKRRMSNPDDGGAQ